MPDPLGYASHLSSEAAAFVISQPRRKQRKVLDLADQPAVHPFRLGDYRTRDAADHEVENPLLDGHLFTFWADHAVKEVRITEIQKV